MTAKRIGSSGVELTSSVGATSVGGSCVAVGVAGGDSGVALGVAIKAGVGSTVAQAVEIKRRVVRRSRYLEVFNILKPECFVTSQQARPLLVRAVPDESGREEFRSNPHRLAPAKPLGF